MDSQTQVLIAWNLVHMEEELAMFFGIKESAKERTLKDAKNGDSSGIQNAELISITPLVVYVLLTVSQDPLILAYPAKKPPMEEVLEHHSLVLQALNWTELFAIHLAKLAIAVLDQFAGEIALQDIILAVLFVPHQLQNAQVPFLILFKTLLNLPEKSELELLLEKLIYQLFFKALEALLNHSQIQSVLNQKLLYTLMSNLP